MPNIKCILWGEPKRACMSTWVTITNQPPIPVLFVIDLNTTKSFISPDNLGKMGIDLNQLPPLPSNVEVYCFGRRVSNKLVAEIREGCSIKFATDTGLYVVPFDDFITVRSRSIRYARLPSVLGVDFLNELNLKLFIDVHGNQVELSM